MSQSPHPTWITRPTVPIVADPSNALSRKADAVRTPFTDALVWLRVEAGLSQNALARRAGFSASYVSRLESGCRAPTWAAIVRLARPLGDRARDALLDAAGFLPTAPPPAVADRDVAELLALLADATVPEAARETARATVRLVVAQARLAQGVAA